ncbi:MAG: FAD-dependent oxidoreductase, partial [Coriobacteriales bacterium]|nr:FAD-dependent oxidoreductase [Coriobacteriales bacterium]
SNSVTVSTLHGCPADEIERIADYLLTQKGLNTCVKCNPTLLGYETARRILDGLGYDYIAFDEHHFLEDLQFDDAVAMFGRLQATGRERGLVVGAKITNTFPVEIRHGELPGDEMYMSGRALLPLSLTVASRLAKALGGELPISYSGGIDAFNIVSVLSAGIRPLTVATTLLKPGGYERLWQLAHLAAATPLPPRPGINVAALSALAEAAAQGTGAFARHRKDYREATPAKPDRALPLFDCADAPCRSTGTNSGCPIDQQIPVYLEQVAAGDFEAAFSTIVADNVLPAVTGFICNHRCQSQCTRLQCDDPLHIRNAKAAAVVAAQAGFIRGLEARADGAAAAAVAGAAGGGAAAATPRVLVIGAGPAGLAAAVYLRRNGVAVSVRELRDKPLGIVSHVIPAFRISDEQLALDEQLARAWGVEIELGAPAEYDLAELKKSWDYVVVATGAWAAGSGPLAVDGTRVLDALDFLARSRTSGLQLNLGKQVAVIGGGDVAMDCARAAIRNAGVEQVVVIYRRTLAQMPAQREELAAARADGVRFAELRSPQSFNDGAMTCAVMELAAEDASGRRSPVATGAVEELAFDTVISAVGAGVDTSAFAANGIALKDNGLARLSESNECSLPGVYIVGDCKAGPATVVQAMADAKLAAADILRKSGIKADFAVPRGARRAGADDAPEAGSGDGSPAAHACEPSAVSDFALQASREQLLLRKGVLTSSSADAHTDSARCLGCNQVCELCVDVCPNRANVAIQVATDATGLVRDFQILHLDGLCNECGNCAVFCPTTGRPYRDKLTLFNNEEDFIDSDNPGFLFLAQGDSSGDGGSGSGCGSDGTGGSDSSDGSGGSYRLRLPEGTVLDAHEGDERVPAAIATVVKTVAERYAYLIG